MVQAKCINIKICSIETVIIVIFYLLAGAFWENCCNSVSLAIAFYLNFNPERHNVRAAVWESPWLHQGVVWRWCVEAGQRASGCQVTLLCHAPGTLVGRLSLYKCCNKSGVCLHFYLVHTCPCLQVYSESVIPRIAKAASGVTGTPYNELMNSWGVYFLGFVGKYGYDRILKVKNKNIKNK